MRLRLFNRSITDCYPNHSLYYQCLWGVIWLWYFNIITCVSLLRYIWSLVLYCLINCLITYTMYNYLCIFSHVLKYPCCKTIVCFLFNKPSFILLHVVFRLHLYLNVIFFSTENCSSNSTAKQMFLL
jgi:hypothetical protein